MYKSPIDVIQEQMRLDVDNAIYKAVQTVGINVDREELIKALQYDRNQYDKGYEDGCKDAAKEVIQWIKRNGTLQYGGYVIHDSTIEQMCKKFGVEVE